MPRFRSTLATLAVGLVLVPWSASAAQEAGAKPAQGPQAERPAAAEPEGPQVPWLTGPIHGESRRPRPRAGEGWLRLRR
jgi:hypothetical protein